MNSEIDAVGRDQLLVALTENGVSGVEDFGRFISNVQFFRPSSFDERAAMPLLIDALPKVHDPALAHTIASHLRRSWARPAAYAVLLDAFKRFGGESGSHGWAIGDSLASAATTKDAPELLQLVTDRRYGKDRQMIVHSLYRFKAADGVASILKTLTEDADVSLHAISAYWRSVGDDTARAHFERLESGFPGSEIARQAKVAIKKIDKKRNSRMPS